MGHADRRLPAAIVVGNHFGFPVPELTVKRLGAAVAGPHLQIDEEDAARARGFLQPLYELASDPRPPAARLNRQQVQVGVFGKELHDGKTDEPSVRPSGQHITVTAANVLRDPRGGPRPGQAGLDEVAGHHRDPLSVSQARQLQFNALTRCLHITCRRPLPTGRKRGWTPHAYHNWRALTSLHSKASSRRSRCTFFQVTRTFSTLPATSRANIPWSSSSRGRASNCIHASAASSVSSMRGCQRPNTLGFSAYSSVMPVRTNGRRSDEAVTSFALR